MCNSIAHSSTSLNEQIISEVRKSAAIEVLLNTKFVIFNRKTCGTLIMPAAKPKAYGPGIYWEGTCYEKNFDLHGSLLYVGGVVLPDR